MTGLKTTNVLAYTADKITTEGASLTDFTIGVTGVALDLTSTSPSLTRVTIVGKVTLSAATSLALDTCTLNADSFDAPLLTQVTASNANCPTNTEITQLQSLTTLTQITLTSCSITTSANVMDVTLLCTDTKTVGSVVITRDSKLDITSLTDFSVKRAYVKDQEYTFANGDKYAKLTNTKAENQEIAFDYADYLLTGKFATLQDFKIVLSGFDIKLESATAYTISSVSISGANLLTLVNNTADNKVIFTDLSLINGIKMIVFGDTIQQYSTSTDSSISGYLTDYLLQLNA